MLTENEYRDFCDKHLAYTCEHNCVAEIKDALREYTEPYVSQEDQDRLLKEMYGPILDQIKVT